MRTPRKRASVGVVADFDGTLTPILKPLMVLVDTRAVPDLARGELDAMRNEFAPKFHAGKLTTREEREWFVQTMALYERHGLRMKDAFEAVRDVKIKPCVESCFRQLRERGVPIAIISFGVRQFIEQVLWRNGNLGRHVDRIYAASLRVDPRTDRVVGHDPETVVLPATKGLWSRRFAEEMGVPKSNLIAVGDTKGDRHLGSRKALRLGLATGADTAAHLKRYMGEIIIDGECFCGAAEWIFAKLDEMVRQ